MTYIIVLCIAAFFVLLTLMSKTDDKVDEQRRELNNLYDYLTRLQDRMNAVQKDRDAVVKDVKAIQTALPALEQQIKELAEPLKVKDRQEKLVLDGMNSILNYNIGQAIKAAKDVSDYGEEE